MTSKIYKFIYGPVSSWRLGASLGIDPISKKGKVCSFDCIYCQVGKTTSLTDKRKDFVPMRNILQELNNLPVLNIDYITLSGGGEPTLAKNLGRLIKAIKERIGKKIAVLTNSSLLTQPDVKKDILNADMVVAKLDAHSQDLFEKINKPIRGLRLCSIIKAIKEFRGRYRGRFALQIMFTNENKRYANDIAKIAKQIEPDEVQINTPLRPCNIRPLSKDQIAIIKRYFEGMNVVSVYDVRKKHVRPLDKKGTERRRGKI